MIHYFNPGHETAVLNGSPYYTAPANVVAMQQELAFIPAWYANEEDLVLVESELDIQFYNYLSNNLGFKPKPISKENLHLYNGMQIALWGISPQAIHFVEELNKELELRLQYPEWKDEYAYLNSRQAASNCLRSLINANPQQISSELLPRFYDKLENIEYEVKHSTSRLLAKAPYSSSGRGLLWLPKGELTRTERQILHGILKKQGSVSIETVLDKQMDFAMEFNANGKGLVEFLGYSMFETNKKGAYLGNYLYSQEDIVKILTEYIDKETLNKTEADIKAVLSDKYSPHYQGCVGVDMLIYKAGNEYRLHPCVEINMRSNMGLLALRIQEKYIGDQSKGKFYIDFSAKEGSLYSKHTKMASDYPPLFEANRLIKGYLPLCPVKEQSHYWAYILID